ncbi:MAG: hypothetical protein Kow0090_22190 [Myxococcota bacterium]
MEKVLWSVIFIVATAASNIAAANSNCYNIRDNDKKYYCLATTKKQDSYCYSIKENDSKYDCLAVVKGQKSYCYSIKDNDKKYACLAKVP